MAFEQLGPDLTSNSPFINKTYKEGEYSILPDIWGLGIYCRHPLNITNIITNTAEISKVWGLI